MRVRSRRWFRYALTLLFSGSILFVVSPAAQADTDIYMYQSTTVYSSTTADHVFIDSYLDVSPAHQHIRGCGDMMVASSSVVHVQIDKINLGTYNGVVATAGPKNSQYGLITDFCTPSVQLTCHLYAVHLYYSIRWRDGSLTKGDIPPWYGDPWCI
jgi:hypothetical protein